MARANTTPSTPEPATLKLPLDGRPVDDDLLLPPNSPGVPPEVAAAEALVREASAAYYDASLAVRAATQEAKSAPRLDSMRDAEALALDEPMPPDRLADQARATLNATLQRQAAELERLRSRQLEYGYCVSRAHSTWSARQDEIVTDAETEATQLLDEFGKALDRLTAARAIRDGLANWPIDGGHLSHVRFVKETERFRAIADADAAAHAADRSGNMHSWIPRDSAHLLAALRIEVTGAAEEPPARAAW